MSRHPGDETCPSGAAVPRCATAEAADVVAGHLLALASLPGVGPAVLSACLRGTGPVPVWDAVVAGRAGSMPVLAPVVARLRSDPALSGLASGRSADPASVLAAAARGIEPEAVLLRHRTLGCEVVPLGSPAYPAALAEDPDPPPILIIRGDQSLLGVPAVAIVGTRNATRAGMDLARELGGGLAARGIAVVSGLALGIDGAAHRGVLEVADGAPVRDGIGRPIGVVATGPDRCYPSRHAGLHRSVAASGVLLSETPIGGRPLRWRFPARNRLIAALAEAVVVVESRTTGGSLSTVTEALHRGRTVLAVPGHPSMPAAAGTNGLLADGATIVRDLEDVLVAIGRGGAEPLIRGPETEGCTVQTPPGRRRSTVAVALLRSLEPGPQTLEHLVEGCGVPVDAVAVTLAELEAEGVVARTGGWFQRTGARVGRRTGEAAR